MLRFRVAAVATLFVAIACASVSPLSTRREPALTTEVQAPGLLFEVLYTEADAPEVPRIQKGLLAIAPMLTRWGTFRHGVYIRVYPDHAALEDAVDRHGYPWLRAWAYGDEILLQSPRTWGPGADSEIDELLLHELTHTLMYQLLQADSEHWPSEEPPLWFREGMASVTAGQGRRRPTADVVAQWVAAHPGEDVLNPSREVYRTEKDAVYGAAHRAFDLLVRLYGDDKVRLVLRGVSEGAKFADSFQSATGTSLQEFEKRAVGTRFALPALSHGAGGGN